MIVGNHRFVVLFMLCVLMLPGYSLLGSQSSPNSSTANGTTGSQQSTQSDFWTRASKSTGDAVWYGVAWALGLIVYEMLKEGWRACRGIESAEEKEKKARAELRDYRLNNSFNDSVQSLHAKDAMINKWCKDGTVSAEDCKKLRQEMFELMKENNELHALQTKANKQKLSALAPVSGGLVIDKGLNLSQVSGKAR